MTNFLTLFLLPILIGITAASLFYTICYLVGKLALKLSWFDGIKPNQALDSPVAMVFLTILFTACIAAFMWCIGLAVMVCLNFPHIN